ncbi:hypothetical protein D9M73_111270 [compost metagenome]
MGVATVVDRHLRARDDGRLAAGERAWLRHLRRFGDADGQPALCDGDRTDPDVRAHHDGARRFVDDDARWLIDIDVDRLDLRHQIDDRTLKAPARRDFDGGGVEHLGCPRETAVDGRHDALCRCKVGVFQRELQTGRGAQRKRHLALDDRATGDPRRGGNAAADAGGGPLRLEARHRHRALCHGVDFPIKRAQRRGDQRAALQAGSIAKRGDLHVDAGAGARKGGHRCGDRHGCHILRLHVRSADVDAHAFEHRLHRFLGEGRVAHPVARAGQAHHQAISDQLVGPDILDIDDIFDPRARDAGRHAPEQNRKRRGGAQRMSDKAANSWKRSHESLIG